MLAGGPSSASVISSPKNRRAASLDVTMFQWRSITTAG
jgi:hypothetical protein